MPTLLPDEAQTQIIDSVRSFLHHELPLERLRNDQRPPLTERQWHAAAALGLFGIGVAESHGGVGLGVVEEVLAMREVGRVVATPSFMATALAAHLVADGEHAALCPPLLNGEQRAHLALAGPQAGEALLVDATPDGWCVVLGADGIGLYHRGVEPVAEAWSLDSSVTLAVGRLDPTACLVRQPAGSALWLRAQLMLAAQLVGLAEQARDLAVAYAKVRQQFGQPIGAFQAVKHHCADMAVQAEVAWAQTLRAAHALVADDPGVTTATSCAKWLAATAAHRNADHAIQVHGGIGFQAECDVHQFMKRAHLFDQTAGSRRQVAADLALA